MTDKKHIDCSKIDKLEIEFEPDSSLQIPSSE